MMRFLAALFFGGLLCGVIAFLAGVGVLDLIVAIWDGAWGTRDAAAVTVTKMTPLLLTGLAVALAYRINLLNIGCEGQLTLGALGAGAFAVLAGPLPSWLLLPGSLAVGAMIG